MLSMFNKSIFLARGYVSLDFLRGFAAWLVAIPHFFLFYGMKSDDLEFLSVFAVEIFFILSGFVLGRQLDLCFKNPSFNILKTFLLRRWLRTLPIFFFVLILLATINNTLFSTKFFEFSTFIYSFFTFDETNNFFIAAWSLAVEEWFYFIFPIFGMLMIRLNFSKGKLLTIFIITFVLVKIYYEIFYDINFHRITVFRLDSIAIGYVAYLITKDYEKISKTLLSTLFLLALFLFVLSYVLFLNKHVFYFVILANLSAMCIVISSRYFNSYVNSKNLITIPSSFLAHTSYSTYLLHTLIFQLLINDNSFSMVSNFFLYIFFIIFFSVASFYIIEKPFLKIRPNYSEINDKKLNFQKKIFIRLFANFLIVFMILFSIEKISAFIPKIYGLSETFLKENPSKIKKQDSIVADIQSYTDKPGLLRDFKNYENVPGNEYYTYLPYRPASFSSEYLNVNKNGIRDNGNRILTNQTDGEKPKIIWILGSSAVFGYSNSDKETIASTLERKLNEIETKYTYIVKNMGVDGYNSLQDYLHFRLKLIEEKKPDMIIVMNGYNDYETASLSGSSDYLIALRTWAVSYDILYEGWEHKKMNEFVAYEIIEHNFFKTFSNTLNMARLVKKWLAFKLYTLNLEKFKKDYVKNKNYYQTIFDLNSKLANDFYIGNIDLIVQHASSNNIKVVLIQQPLIYNIDKKLVGDEIDIIKHKKIEYFALQDEELSSLENIPTYEIQRKYFLDYDQYRINYERQNERLDKLAIKRDVNYLDLGDKLQKIDHLPIFTSLVHFTYHGTEIISEIIFNKIHNIL